MFYKGRVTFEVNSLLDVLTKLEVVCILNGIAQYFIYFVYFYLLSQNKSFSIAWLESKL